LRGETITKITATMKYLITIALILGLLFGGTSILQVILGTKYPIMVVVSQSMVPTLGVGDYIIVGRANVTQLVAAPQPRGDIIVFRRSARAGSKLKLKSDTENPM